MKKSETVKSYLSLIPPVHKILNFPEVLRQIASMSLLTPRFWSEGPLPGISGSGWT